MEDLTLPDLEFIGEFEAATDGSMAAALARLDSVSRQKVIEIITPVLADNPDVISAASTAAVAAVDARANELGLVRTSTDAEPAETYFRGADPAKKSWLGFRRKDGGIASRTVTAIVNAIHIYAGYEAPFVYPGNFVLWVDFNESGADMFKKVEA